MVRWSVEQFFGRVKNKFRFLKTEMPNIYTEKISRFLRFATAILNYQDHGIRYDPVKMDELVTRTLERMKVEDSLLSRIEISGLSNPNNTWTVINHTVITDFPKLTMQDLEILTLGKYQTSLAPEYTKSHLNETYEVYSNPQFQGLLKVRLGSRFRAAVYHYLYIEYWPNRNGAEGLSSWHCQCQVGARLVGCCGHIASVFWFLGLGRYSPLPMSRISYENVKNAPRKLNSS